MDNKNESMKRAYELHIKGQEFLLQREDIALGINSYYYEEYNSTKEKIIHLLGANNKLWEQWEWQMKNQINSIDFLKLFVNFSEQEIDDITSVSKRYRWSITPYYAALMSVNKQNDPIRKISIPSIEELINDGMIDPTAEECSNPVGGIIRRYPDRVILNITNSCAGFCRHCQRKRNIGEIDSKLSDHAIVQSIEYIKNNTEIRDVLITGGDPFTLSNNEIENLICRIREIKHVEIIRIGTRTLVTMPQRINEQLVTILKKYHPIFINTQFNHPREITPESQKACCMLRNGGVILGNQMVLLKGVNDDKYTVRLLNQELLKIGVKPYYIFHAKDVTGTMHFKSTIEKGLEILSYLQGNTSGLAIPRFIVSAPGGKGKIPLQPNYVVEENLNSITLKTWENNIVHIPITKK